MLVKWVGLAAPTVARGSQLCMVSMMVGGKQNAEGGTERQEGERGIVNVPNRESEDCLLIETREEAW